MTTKIIKTNMNSVLDQLQSEFGEEKIAPLIIAMKDGNRKSRRDDIGMGKGDDVGIT